MGKSEAPPQRFRRKAKGQDSSSGASERISNSHNSSLSTVDNLLCDNLLDSNITTELHVSSPSQTPQLDQSLATANGTCDVELNDSDRKEHNHSLIRDNGAAVAAVPHEDPDRPKDSSLSCHLPVELSGLSHSEITPLCSNQCLDLSACHVLKEDSLALVVFIYNSSDSDIQQIQLHLDSDELEVQ